MPKFRKKPVVIEAVQIDSHDHDGMYAILSWIGATGAAVDYDNSIIAIHTLEGTMEAGHGDWIIKGVHGEFYPCKPDIFAATYEPVEGTAEPTPEQREMPPVVAGAGYCYPANPGICSGCGAVAPLPHYRSCTAVG